MCSLTLERGEGRERNIHVREKCGSVASRTRLGGGLNPQQPFDAGTTLQAAEPLGQGRHRTEDFHDMFEDRKERKTSEL